MARHRRDEYEDEYDDEDDYEDDYEDDARAPRRRRRRRRQEAHRGGLILAMGILSWVVCPICGILAWIWGNEDVAKIRSGRMERSGEGLTQAGRVLGMISVILCCIALGIWLLLAVAVTTG